MTFQRVSGNNQLPTPTQLEARGTSEGVKKAWNTRGRGKSKVRKYPHRVPVMKKGTAAYKRWKAARNAASKKEQRQAAKELARFRLNKTPWDGVRS